MRAYSPGLVGSSPANRRSKACLRRHTVRKVVGNHLRLDSCARVVDWQGGEEICW